MTLAGGARQRGGYSYDDVPLIAFGGNNTAGPIDVATARNACNSGSGRLDFESETFVVAAHAFDARQRDVIQHGDMCGPLDTDPHTHAVCVAFDSRQDAVAFVQNSRSEVRMMGGDGQVSGAVAADHGVQQQTYIHQRRGVRRLTPRECERLQGAPDDYTLLDAKTKDGPRYKAIGNSWAVTQARWVGARINEAFT